MNANEIRHAAHESHQDRLPFPEFVGKLIGLGVEFYHVNYLTGQVAFYSETGACVVVSLNVEDLPTVAKEFNGEALRAAIRDSQLHAQPYRDFSQRAVNAGVQSYFTFLRGQRVVYIGRQGEQHTEWFPGAQPAGGE